VPRDPAARISVANKACSVHDFAMGIDTSISGHVFDNARPQQPLGSALVGLIDLNHPISEPDTHPWFNQEYTEHDFAYKFENVPIGRYLLVFNPDGPRTGGLYDLPLESNYYPASSTRSAAKVIEVTSAGVHLTGMDLVAGERVEFRQVVVGVRFSDGAPMKTAAIRCVALPLKEGEPSLVFKNFPLLEKDDGTVHILAPANRKLRIEVQDAYGRKLNGSYAATYEPGSTPITQEFVVTP
jgi:hypothetical protein